MTEDRRRRNLGPPTPGEITLQIQAVVDGLRQLQSDYQGTYLAAFGPAVVGDGGRSNGSSDPTGTQALNPSRIRLRAACKRAEHQLGSVQAEIRSAIYVLDRVMTAVDPPPTPNLPMEDRYSASRAEVAYSREAQERRRGRGEGWAG